MLSMNERTGLVQKFLPLRRCPLDFSSFPYFKRTVKRFPFFFLLKAKAGMSVRFEAVFIVLESKYDTGIEPSDYYDAPIYKFLHFIRGVELIKG
jgi:hypothetical protein